MERLLEDRRRARRIGRSLGSRPLSSASVSSAPPCWAMKSSGCWVLGPRASAGFSGCLPAAGRKPRSRERGRPTHPTGVWPHEIHSWPRSHHRRGHPLTRASLKVPTTARRRRRRRRSHRSSPTQPRSRGSADVHRARRPNLLLDAHREETFALIHPAAPRYNTLLRIDPFDKTGTRVVGDLAESWTVSPDRRTCLKLRRGEIPATAAR